MDAVASAAQGLMRESSAVLQVAAEELAKQANTVAQIANSTDPLAWLAGEDDEGDGDSCQEGPPPAVLNPVPLCALPSWGSGWSFGGAPADPLGGAAALPKLPFPVDHSLNHKIYLWEGDLLSLEVQALITPTATGYAAGASTVFGRVLKYGGRDLKGDLRLLDSCRSGEARVTKAYNLPCHRLILTIGPKFKDKYQIAAQNTLNACYRECLQQAAEHEAKTVGIPCKFYEKGFPIEEQVHVALRSLRKCLEKLRKIESVVVAAASAEELSLYDSLMPLYFPRTEEEALIAAQVEPDGCWSDWGELAVEERKIRVATTLVQDDEDRSEDSLLFSPGDDDDRSFLDARSDADGAARKRLEVTLTEAETPEQAKQACVRYLRRSRELRAEPEGVRFVYRAPRPDRFGRRAIILLGAKLPALGLRDERTLPLFVKELELLENQHFVLLYANSAVAALDTTKLEVLQEMLAMISIKYRSNLDQVLVLHPGLWFRAAFALGRAMSDTAASIWHDTVYLENLADLGAFATAEQLGLPDYIRHNDPL